ncbi:hypothetical protein FGLOB1_3886 [Fusarium globosum]|uniref:Uncharacterized protein n=1 Tax=Fusarium globosum TaxID=78864 RepID=A0A8H6DDK2_9HYPO|nr:hypothetical protein FGLOB1_3886 [Fusarium globosum]
MDTPIAIPSLNDPNVALHFGAQLLERISPDDYVKSDGVCNLHYAPDASHIVPSQNGFIWAAADTHDRNTGLSIQVDNIWLAILAQLKPFILGAFRIQEAQKIPDFTLPELRNPHMVAERLRGMVGTTFGPQPASVLMPDFSTTTPTYTGAAALILLGKHCQVQHHRVFSPPRDIYERQHQQVHGDAADWNKLREKLGTIQTWSPAFKPMIEGHVSFLDDMLATGNQFYKPAPHVAAPPGASQWTVFWAGMLKLIHGRMIVGGWILCFFDPSKVVYGGTFNDNVTSAVTTLPVRVHDIGGPRNCTMVGGFLGHSHGASGVHDRSTQVELGLVRPMAGWLVYAEKEPPAQKNHEDEEMTEAQT